MSIKFIFKSLFVYGYVYHFCYSRHVSYSPSSYFSQDNTCTNDCTANNCSTNDCATNYCATHHCSTVSTVMIHILMIILVSCTHILGILTLFTTMFFTELRPNLPHLNHLLSSQPPRSLQLKVPQRGHQRRVENVLVMRYVTWPSAPHTMDAQGHRGKRISLPLSSMRALGVTFVRDMANHKLSYLLMFEFRVRATTEDARSTAEANHSDKWKKKWMVFYASVGYANHEQFRNMGLLWTLKSVRSST